MKQFVFALFCFFCLISCGNNQSTSTSNETYIAPDEEYNMKEFMKREGWSYVGKSPTAYRSYGVKGVYNEVYNADDQSKYWYVWSKSENGKTRYAITCNDLNARIPISGCYDNIRLVSEGNYCMTESESGRIMYFKYKVSTGGSSSFYLEL